MDLMVNAWRRRIGFMCPSVLETTIPNFTSFAPEGVGICAITSNIEDWDKNEFERAMNKVVADAKSLATRGVDYIIFSGGPLLTSRGKGADIELRNRIMDATGLDATTTITSAVQALEYLNIKRVAMLSPFPQHVQRATIDFLRAHDFDVLKDDSMDIHFRALHKVGPDEIYRRAGALLTSTPEADGLYIPCPQWPTQKAVEAIERDYGKPVVTCDPADFWMAFRSLGIHDRIENHGILLRSLSERRDTPPASGAAVRLAS
jgi:maleate cis-trans isomerase